MPSQSDDSRTFGRESCQEALGGRKLAVLGCCCTQTPSMLGKVVAIGIRNTYVRVSSAHPDNAGVTVRFVGTPLFLECNELFLQVQRGNLGYSSRKITQYTLASARKVALERYSSQSTPKNEIGHAISPPARQDRS